MKRRNKLIIFTLIILLAIIVLILISSQNEQTQVEATPTNAPIRPIATYTPSSGSTATDTPDSTYIKYIDDTLAEHMDGQFAYLIMALSWSPDFCASIDNDDPQQCPIGAGLGFILHGVWPSYGHGYPSYCSDEKMSDDLMYEYPGIYPNDFLYGHEWGKHGTCTGLDPEEYLIMSQQLKESISIPAAFDSPEEPFRTSVDELLEAFMQANPNFEEESFAVNCSESGAYLTELYVCYSKDGYPSECGSDVLDIASESCSQPDFLVRKVR